MTSAIATAFGLAVSQAPGVPDTVQNTAGGAKLSGFDAAAAAGGKRIDPERLAITHQRGKALLTAD